MYSAAAAAKINAQIQAKKGIQHVDVPPIRAVCCQFKDLSKQNVTEFHQTQSPSAPPKSESPGAGNSASTVNGEMYIADGDYIRDIEVNDLRNRYTLTKGSTQKMVNTPRVKATDTSQTILSHISILSLLSCSLCVDDQAHSSAIALLQTPLWHLLTPAA